MKNTITTYHFNINSGFKSFTKPFLKSYHCLIYLTEGAGILKTGDRLYPLKAGQCFLLPAGTQACYWANSRAGWRYIWITFNGPMFAEIISRTGFAGGSPVCTCLPEQSALIRDLQNKRYEYHGRDYYEKLGDMVRLLASFIETNPAEGQIETDGSFASISAYIDNNLSAPDLNVTTLMKVTGLGRTALYLKFKEESNRAPSDYIRALRLAKAKHLLRSTELPVSQIAFAVGFEDPLYFSRAFRKYVDLSPTEYRKYYTRNRQSQQG